MKEATDTICSPTDILIKSPQEGLRLLGDPDNLRLSLFRDSLNVLFYAGLRLYTFNSVFCGNNNLFKIAY